ncbi:MAG: Histidine ammonia-lyase [Bacteroidota bacterium]|jgi:histidine ammonia-lyase
MQYISNEKLSIAQLQQLVLSDTKIALSENTIQQIKNCRSFLENKLADNNRLYYGINTGFGSLCNVRINENELEDLQYKLVVSTACGIGDELPLHFVKILLLLKIQSLSYGYSGITIEAVQLLVDMYNEDMLPLIYKQGSLGASGDLAPLAHMAMAMMGIGDCFLKGKRIKAVDALKAINQKPIILKSKEGLALLNGTQFMSSHAVWCLMKAHRLIYLSDLIAAISVEGFDAKLEPFTDTIHNIRPHAGQIKTALNINEFLKDSEIIAQEKQHVQDPYSFRCVPQVHGASKDAVAHITNVVETEINSVTDNPIVDPANDRIISGGNFHGQPLAINLDYLAIAVAELANISERRTYQMLSGARNLPVFLVDKPGLNCGLMIPQYTAAALVSQNKQLCTPASVDSIVSCNGQEDHVSMGANAATKCVDVLLNTERVLAIELLTAMQALDYRKPLKSSAKIEAIRKSYREVVPFITEDRVFHDDMVKSVEFIQQLIIE